MTFQAIAVQVLIASPADVVQERQAAEVAMARWNAMHARDSGVTLLPITWETHAYPEMGARPQEIVNKQIVRQSDVLVGIFWTRVGTPTGVAESGTVEDVKEFIEAGKPVLLYFASRPVAPDSVDPGQLAAVRTFKNEIRAQGLVDDFESIEDFGHKLLFALTRLARERFGGSVGDTETPARADVRANIDVEARTKADRQGRIRTQSHYYLILENEGTSPAYGVTFHFPDLEKSQAPRVLSEGPVPTLVPRGNVRFPVAAHMGTARMFDIILTWKLDPDASEDEVHEFRQTLTL